MARRYEVADRFEAAFVVILGAESEIGFKNRVTVHSAATESFVAVVLDRSLLEKETDVEWKERGRVLV